MSVSTAPPTSIFKVVSLSVKPEDTSTTEFFFFGKLPELLYLKGMARAIEVGKAAIGEKIVILEKVAIVETVKKIVDARIIRHWTPKHKFLNFLSFSLQHILYHVCFSRCHVLDGFIDSIGAIYTLLTSTAMRHLIFSSMSL